jgi:hypothetical protein
LRSLLLESAHLSRYPGLAHSVKDALALSQKDRIVARHASTVALDREVRIKCKPSFGRSPRLIRATEMRQRRGEPQVRRWVISVGLDGATQPPTPAPPEPELLAYHFTQAGLNEAAIEWWGKAGQRSLERSALVEAVGQFTRALDQIASLPATPARRREEIKLQVALITPLLHVKGHSAPETKAAGERARLLIEQVSR